MNKAEFIKKHYHYRLGYSVKQFESDLTALMQLPGGEELEKWLFKILAGELQTPQLWSFEEGFRKCYDWLTQHREQPAQLPDMTGFINKQVGSPVEYADVVNELLYGKSEPDQPVSAKNAQTEMDQETEGCVWPDDFLLPLPEPPQAKGVSREEAEKVIWSMREWQSSPSTRTDCATYQLLIDRNDVKILETYIYSNKDGNSVQLLKEKLNDMIDRLNQSQPVNEGWIKVEDQLPEDDEIVLTYHKRGQSLCEARHGGLWSSQINWIGDYDVSPVSHWRQIPSPPKPEKL